MIHITDKLTDMVIGILDNDIEEKSYWNDKHVDSENLFETFDFETRSDVAGAEHLTGQNRIIIPADRPGEYREFVIFNVYKATGGIMEVKSNGSYVEIAKDPHLTAFDLGGIGPEAALAYGITETEWDIGKVEYAPVTAVKSDGAMDRYTYLTMIADLFGLVLNFRVEIEGNKIVGRYVDLLQNVGTNNGKEIILGKDLVGIQRHESTENVLTALVVEGPKNESGGRISITVANEEARQRWGRNGRHRWGYYEIEEVEGEAYTETTVRALGEKRLEGLINSTIQYEVDSISLEHVFGLSHERALKGDSVRIKDETFSPPLYLDARIISVERAPSNPKTKKFTLGDFIEYTEDEIMATFRKLQKELALKIDRGEIEEQILDAGVYTGPLPPDSPKLNRLWMDTSVTPNVLKRWNGDVWVKASPTTPGDIGAETPEQTQARIDAMRNDINVEMGELSDALGDFENTINTTFKDGIIEESEAKAIEKYKNSVNSEKADVDSRYTTIYNNSLLSGTPKTNLASAKTALNTAHSNLIASINAAIADDKTTDTEKADVDAKFATYNSAMGTLSTRFEQAIAAIGAAQADSTSSSKVAIMQLRIEQGKLSETNMTLSAEVNELGQSEWLDNNPVVTALSNAYTIFNDSVVALYNEISNVIADDVLTVAENNNLETLRSTYRGNLASLIRAIRDAEEEIVRVSANEVMEFGERKIFKGSQTPDPAKVLDMDLWLDATVTPPVWKQYTNGSWTLISRTDLSQFDGQVNGGQIAPNVINSNMIVSAGLDAGVITFGTMTGITADVTQAGMTSTGTLSTSVRFWAGSTYLGRSNAPFIVRQNGAVEASNVLITGGEIIGPRVTVSNAPKYAFIQDGEVRLEYRTSPSGAASYRSWLDYNGINFFTFNYTRTGIYRETAGDGIYFRMPGDSRFAGSITVDEKITLNNATGTEILKIEQLDTTQMQLNSNSRRIRINPQGASFIDYFELDGGSVLRGSRGTANSSLFKWTSSGIQVRTHNDGSLASIVASNVGAGSDPSDKEDVKTVDRSINKVRDMKLYDYKRKQPSPGWENVRQLGLMIDEAPEEVTGPGAVDLYSYISLVAKGVQELSEVVESGLSPGNLGTEAGETVAKQINHALQLFAHTLPEEKALEVAGVFPQWKINQGYKPGDRIQYGLNADNEPQLYVVIQAHTSQADWTPDVSASLFKKIGFTPEGVPLWVQPVGAADAYQMNDIVMHNDQKWKSTAANNVWEPGVYGWTIIQE